jgi:hypothetical protein
MAIAARRAAAFQPAASKAQRRSVACQADRNTTIHKLIEQEGVLLVPGELRCDSARPPQRASPDRITHACRTPHRRRLL